MSAPSTGLELCEGILVAVEGMGELVEFLTCDASRLRRHLGQSSSSSLSSSSCTCPDHCCTFSHPSHQTSYNFQNISSAQLSPSNRAHLENAHGHASSSLFIIILISILLTDNQDNNNYAHSLTSTRHPTPANPLNLHHLLSSPFSLLLPTTFRAAIAKPQKLGLSQNVVLSRRSCRLEKSAAPARSTSIISPLSSPTLPPSIYAFRNPDLPDL